MVVVVHSLIVHSNSYLKNIEGVKCHTMTLANFDCFRNYRGLVSAESYPHDGVKDEGSRKPDQGQDQAPIFFHPSNEPFFDGRTFHSSGFRNNFIESVKPWHDYHIEWLSRTLNLRMKHKFSIQSSMDNLSRRFLICECSKILNVHNSWSHKTLFVFLRERICCTSSWKMSMFCEKLLFRVVISRTSNSLTCNIEEK